MSVGRKCVLPGQQAEQGILLLLDALLMWHDQDDCAWAVVVCLLLPAIAAIRQLAVRRGMLLLLALLAVCKHSGVQATSARTAAATAAPVCEAIFLAALAAAFLGSRQKVQLRLWSSRN